jgi:hypothetical protein
MPFRIYKQSCLNMAAVLTCGIAATFSICVAQPAPPASEPAGKFQVELAGGGRIVGRMVTSELAFQGEFGRLQIPWAKVHEVVPGFVSRPALERQLKEQVELLADPSFAVREEAQKTLSAFGVRARLFLEKYRNEEDLERRNRVRALLAELPPGAGEESSWQQEDLVIVGEKREPGRILPPAIEVETAAGRLSIPVGDIEAIGLPRDPRPIDLLRRLDVARDSISGKWTMDGAALVSPVQNRGRVQAPVVPPTNYNLRLTVEATVPRMLGPAKIADSLFIGIQVMGRPCYVALNAFGDLEGGPYAGLDAIEGRRTHQTRLYTGRVLEMNKVTNILVRVRGPAVEVLIDDKPLFSWEDDPAKLSVYESWRLPNPRMLGLGAHLTGYRITRWELTQIDHPQPLARLAADEAKIELLDGTLLAARIDDGQTVAVTTGGASRQIAMNDLLSLRHEVDGQAIRLTLSSGETLTVDTLPRTTIKLTSRYGKLEPPLAALKLLDCGQKPR